MTSPQRISEVSRKTSETAVTVRVDLDGHGKTSVSTGAPFFDHMLDLLGRHSLMDLTVQTVGDLEIDAHHTVEDTGLAIGSAIKQALGDKSGINRYGFFLLPMDEVLAEVALDLSGRPYLTYDVSLPYDRVGEFDTALAQEFFRAVANELGATIHMRCSGGNDPHHVIEALFKGFARALGGAVRRDPRVQGIPSTKGAL